MYIRRKDGLFDFEHHDGGCTADQTDVDATQNQNEIVKRQELFHCGICAKILLDLGVKKVRPIIGRPDHGINFEAYDLRLAERVTI